MSFFNKLWGNNTAQKEEVIHTTTVTPATVVTETETARLGAIVQPVIVKEKQIDVAVAPVVASTTLTARTDLDARDVVTEKKYESAALAQEKIHIREAKEYQPEITRDIYKTEVRQITQPVHEERTLPVQERKEVLPEKLVELNNYKSWSPAPIPTAQSLTDTQVERVERAPIIHERVHTRIVEDVQPVIYRDVYQPQHTLITQPIHEVVREAPVVVTSTAPVVENRSFLEKTGLTSFFNRTSEKVASTAQTTQSTMANAAYSAESTMSNAAHRAASALSGAAHRAEATMSNVAHRAEAEIKELRPNLSMFKTSTVQREESISATPLLMGVSATKTSTLTGAWVPVVEMAGVPSPNDKLQQRQVFAQSM